MASFREETASKFVALLAPVSSASPAGLDVSFDGDFGRLKGEIDKLNSVTDAQPAWPDVQRLAAQILTNKSKDLRVATWFTVAKIRTQGWLGFAESVVVYDALVRGFWDTMYPSAKRTNVRLNALGWMVDQAVQHLESVEVKDAEEDAVRACDTILAELDVFLADRVGEAYGGAGSLRSLVRTKLQSRGATPSPDGVAGTLESSPDLAADAHLDLTANLDVTASHEAFVDVDAKPLANAPPVAPPARAAAVPLAAEAVRQEDPEQEVRSHARDLVEVAARMRASDPTAPWSYRIHRAASWIAVQQDPPAEQGKTHLRAPPQGERRRIAFLRDSAKWLELLLFAEETSGYFLFWLDLHRHVAFAMDTLGPSYVRAREVVGREVVAFVARVPSVPDLAFSDGTPFADAATKIWLEDELRRGLPAGGTADSSVSAGREHEEITARLAEARQLVTAGKVADGLGMASALARRGADGRTRFRTRLAAAQMALDASKPGVARPMLESLVEAIDRQGLEAWEPELCATVYASLLRAVRGAALKNGGPSDAGGKEQLAFDRLCRLDPASAMKLSGV